MSQRVLDLVDRLQEGRLDEGGERELEAALSALSPESRALADRAVALARERQRFRRGLVQTAKVAEVGLAFAELIHELRQPLASIAGFSQLLDRQSPPEQVERNTEEIRLQTARMEALIERMRRFVRADEPEAEGPRAVALEPTLRKAVALVPKMPPGVRLDLHVASGLGSVLAEELPLTQVLLNLVANARDAQERKGPGTVSVRAERQDDRVVVTVADEGTGIPEGFVPRLFEPFATTKGVSGTGLGLYICRELVGAWGGEVALVSPAPRPFATAFQVSLKVAEAAVPAPPPELQAVRAELSRELAKTSRPRRALVVEHDAGVRRVLRVLLAAEPGVEVEEAPDALHALQHLASHPADFVLVERGLPGVNGVEFLQRARAEGRLAEAALITGFPSPETALEALAAGACGLFLKPVQDPEALRACLREALAREEERRCLIVLAPMLRPWAERALRAARLSGSSETVIEALGVLCQKREGPARIGVVAERALVGPLSLAGHRAEGPWEPDRALASLDEVEAVVLGEGLDLDQAFALARQIREAPWAPALVWALPAGNWEETRAMVGDRTTTVVRRPLDYTLLARETARVIELRRLEQRAQALRVVRERL